MRESLRRRTNIIRARFVSQCLKVSIPTYHVRTLWGHCEPLGSLIVMGSLLFPHLACLICTRGSRDIDVACTISCDRNRNRSKQLARSFSRRPTQRLMIFYYYSMHLFDASPTKRTESILLSPNIHTKANQTAISIVLETK